MIFSMTGYAANTRESALGALHLELKSVNSRYLDIVFRAPEELRSTEIALRELFTSRLNRGKLECRISFTPATSSATTGRLNMDLVQRLKQYEEEVRYAFPQAAPLSVNEILRWPGMVGETVTDAPSLRNECIELAAHVLEEFTASRAREGAKLAEVILQRVVAMRTQITSVEPFSALAQENFEEKLKLRLQEALGAIDSERLRQELALFALRIDVTEEIARLRTHLDEVERILKTGGVSGKRLDFLMQELNREANTLGSKSVMSEISKVAMELKLLIEQMREQIQNLE